MEDRRTQEGVGEDGGWKDFTQETVSGGWKGSLRMEVGEDGGWEDSPRMGVK